MGTTEKFDVELLWERRSIPEAFYAQSDSGAGLLMYPEVDRDNHRTWHHRSYSEAEARINRLAHALIAMGAGPNCPVAIVCNTRPEWVEADMAILATGAPVVAIYQSLPWTEIGFILHDSGAKIVIAENREQVNKLLELSSRSCPIPARDDIPSSEAKVELKGIIAIEKVSPHPLVTQLQTIVEGSTYPTSRPQTVAKISRDDLASLVYTSGTTGPPKGVAQSHGNYLANVWQAAKSGMFAFDGSLFLFLPLAHSFARLIGFIGMLTPAKLAFPSVTDRETSKLDLAIVTGDMKEANAEVLPSVPRLFEKIKSGVEGRARGRGLSALLLRLCIEQSLSAVKLARAGRPIPLFTQLAVAGTKGIRTKIRHKLFGDRFVHAISGGAKLPVDVNEFFDALEIPIFEGYGLTETCVATHVNLTHRRKIGSVGPALERVETRIQEADGEILLRGPNVTKGYFNRPKATEEAWDKDGWFHTGDIGRIDEDGFLFITDRKKDLIVTAGGKKIAPQSIEGLLNKLRLVSHSVLVGEGRPYCAALITLDPVEVDSWCRERKIRISGAACEDNDIRTEVWNQIQQINIALASHETIKKFRILHGELTVENGFLTPTLKVKRKAVTTHYKPLIEDIYSE